MSSERLTKRHQALATELPTERVCVFSYGEAEHDIVEIIAAQGVRQRRRGQRVGKAAHSLAVLGATYLVGRKRYMVGPSVTELGVGDFALPVHRRRTAMSCHSRARLASGWLAGLYREGGEPSGSLRKVSDHT